jgi:hypothetical protein
MLANAQEEIERARPQLMADAANLPQEAFNWDWKNENHYQWQLSYFSVANDDYYTDESLPACLHLSNSVFPQFLSPTYCRKAYQQVYKKLFIHLKSTDTEPASNPLELPDYHEQVLNCFLQEACLTQALSWPQKPLKPVQIQPSNIQRA